MDAWLIVGLGNPGDRYASTRHNAGRRVVELLARRLDARFKKVRFNALEVAEAKDGDARLLLARPLTYMNLSGPPAASFAKKHEIPPERVVAVHDEIDLPFGALKLKTGGGTAGHRGLDSLAQALRDKGFHRVRIGVGRPSGRQDPADFVLEPFAKREREYAQVLIEESADAVLTLVRDGLQAAQDRHNRSAGGGIDPAGG